MSSAPGTLGSGLVEPLPTASRAIARCERLLLGRIGGRRREQGRQHAVVHQGVDLDALVLGRVLAGGDVVALERGLLRAVHGRRRPAAAS